MAIQMVDELTARERELMDHDKEMTLLNQDHAYRMAQLEAKWSSWIKIPVTIILLPVKFVMAFGIIVHSIRGTEPSEKFWRILG